MISKEFARFGGPEELFKMCHACRANVRTHNIAECAGHIFQRPDSPETEAQLKGIISRLGLESKMEECFPSTSPVWYGLWAVSPIPIHSLSILRGLLSEMLVEDIRDGEAGNNSDREQFRGFSTIISAIERAETAGLRLHAQLMPLGHTDFGFYTIFPHCPFCKAAAQVKRWQRKYPTEHYTCHVCGTRFSPAETASVKRMDWDEGKLREALGDEAFRRFARDYLIALGETPETAEGIVEETEAEESKRLEKRRLIEELNLRRERFLEEHVLAGLACLPAPPSEITDEAQEHASSNGCTGWFDASNFAKVLERCARLGITVRFMQHYSSDGECDRSEGRNLKCPLETLADWQAEGCAEKFHASFQVPDSLLKSSGQNRE